MLSRFVIDTTCSSGEVETQSNSKTSFLYKSLTWTQSYVQGSEFSKLNRWKDNVNELGCDVRIEYVQLMLLLYSWGWFGDVIVPDVSLYTALPHPINYNNFRTKGNERTNTDAQRHIYKRSMVWALLTARYGPIKEEITCNDIQRLHNY